MLAAPSPYVRALVLREYARISVSVVNVIVNVGNAKSPYAFSSGSWFFVRNTRAPKKERVGINRISGLESNTESLNFVNY